MRLISFGLLKNISNKVVSFCKNEGSTEDKSCAYPVVKCKWVLEVHNREDKGHKLPQRYYQCYCQGCAFSSQNKHTTDADISGVKLRFIM